MPFAPFPISIELSRNMVAFPNDRLDAWYVEATNAISEWEESLDTLEEILLAGEFEKLNHFPLLAEESLKLLVRVQELRDQLLSEANALGLPASSLTRLVDFLGLKGGTRQLRSLQNRFHRSYARMLAAWTHLRLCDETVEGMIRLIATGSSAEATYSANERRHLEGGILMDESA
ncbi:MAG: hypothetical protein JNK90_04815 [Planctomycetaceae bacterium]|nr:hypothetical protein [Planctomycetaceae bacterium]